MAVKIQCTACQKTMKVPDEARGRSVKCAECGEKIKVPAAGGDEPQQKAAKPKEKAAVKPAAKSGKSGKPAAKVKAKDEGSGHDIASLELGEMETHHDEQICPFCATPLPPPPEEEDEVADEVCRNCGMNVVTGKMDAKEARTRARKGPPIEKFYSGCWKDAWEYLLKYKSLGIKSGIFWTVFGVISMVCSYMWIVYSERGPPRAFWAGMTFVAVGGMTGWYWWLSIRLIQAAMQEEQLEADRIHIDFFSNVALGLRGVIWPIVLMLPAVLLCVATAALMMLLDYEQFYIPLLIAGGLSALSYVLFPLALIHMTGKYTYKAWILSDLLPVFLRTMVPVMYWWMVAFAAFLPILLLFGPMCYWLKGEEPIGLGTINPLVSKNFMAFTDRIAQWMTELMGEKPSEDSTTYWLVGIFLNLTFGAILISPITFLAGFCAVYVMRVTGQLGYYCQLKLGMVGKVNVGQPATLGIRFLAFWGDLVAVPLATMIVTGNKNVWMAGMGLDVALIGNYFVGKPEWVFPYLFVLVASFHTWMYFSVQESSGTRTTLAKEAFGLIVQHENGRQLKMEEASKRFFLAALSGLTCGAGFLLGLLHKKYRTFHDTASKTVVVFRGDK